MGDNMPTVTVCVWQKQDIDGAIIWIAQCMTPIPASASGHHFTFLRPVEQVGENCKPAIEAIREKIKNHYLHIGRKADFVEIVIHDHPIPIYEGWILESAPSDGGEGAKESPPNLHVLWECNKNISDGMRILNPIVGGDTNTLVERCNAVRDHVAELNTRIAELEGLCRGFEGDIGCIQNALGSHAFEDEADADAIVRIARERDEARAECERLRKDRDMARHNADRAYEERDKCTVLRRVQQERDEARAECERLRADGAPERVWLYDGVKGAVNWVPWEIHASDHPMPKSVEYIRASIHERQRVMLERIQTLMGGGNEDGDLEEWEEGEDLHDAIARVVGELRAECERLREKCDAWVQRVQGLRKDREAMRPVVEAVGKAAEKRHANLEHDLSLQAALFALWTTYDTYRAKHGDSRDVRVELESRERAEALAGRHVLDEEAGVSPGLRAECERLRKQSEAWQKRGWELGNEAESCERERDNIHELLTIVGIGKRNMPTLYNRVKTLTLRLSDTQKGLDGVRAVVKCCHDILDETGVGGIELPDRVKLLKAVITEHRNAVKNWQDEIQRLRAGTEVPRLRAECDRLRRASRQRAETIKNLRKACADWLHMPKPAIEVQPIRNDRTLKCGICGTETRGVCLHMIGGTESTMLENRLVAALDLADAVGQWNNSGSSEPMRLAYAQYQKAYKKACIPVGSDAKTVRCISDCLAVSIQLEEAHEALRKCAKYTGGLVSPECTHEFHMHVPGQVKGHVAKLQGRLENSIDELDRLRKGRSELGTTLARLVQVDPLDSAEPMCLLASNFIQSLHNECNRVRAALRQCASIVGVDIHPDEWSKMDEKTASKVADRVKQKLGPSLSNFLNDYCNEYPLIVPDKTGLSAIELAMKIIENVTVERDQWHKANEGLQRRVNRLSTQFDAMFGCVHETRTTTGTRIADMVVSENPLMTFEMHFREVAVTVKVDSGSIPVKPWVPVDTIFIHPHKPSPNPDDPWESGYWSNDWDDESGGLPFVSAGLLEAEEMAHAKSRGELYDLRQSTDLDASRRESDRLRVERAKQALCRVVYNLLDAISMPNGRDFQSAWESACLHFGRYGESPNLFDKANAEVVRLKKECDHIKYHADLRGSKLFEAESERDEARAKRDRLRHASRQRATAIRELRGECKQLREQAREMLTTQSRLFAQIDAENPLESVEENGNGNGKEVEG